MNSATRTIVVLLGTALCAFVVQQRLQVSYDLTAFLPAPTNQAQTVLSERLGQGAGAQLIMVALTDSSPQQAQDLAAQLRAGPYFSRVLPDNEFTNTLPEVIWRYRLLLGDLPATQHAWQEVLTERSDDLMFGADEGLLNIIAADPALLAVDALERFSASLASPNFSVDSKQILLLETQAPGFDMQAQMATVAELRRQLVDYPQTQLYGAPVYAVDLQAAVKYESTLFSVLASFALLVFVIYRFRQWQQILGVALPLFSGAAMGILALTLVFESTHGITLAFGFTLLGVAIDYPLHIYSHQLGRHSASNVDVWPTLRIGIASTLLAYGVFIFSGTTGLQQLGVFASVGITTAALVCAFLTAGQPQARKQHDEPKSRQNFRYLPSASVAALGLAGFLMAPSFSDDLGSLTPVDANTLAADSAIRANMGVTDPRYLISVHSEDIESNLRTNEAIVERLAPLLADGSLQGARSISDILPSAGTQQRRLAALAQDGAQRLFLQAAAALNYHVNAFEPFITSWEKRLHSQDLLTYAKLRADPNLASLVDASIYASRDAWTSFIYLQGITSLDAIEALLEAQPSAQLIDLKTTANDMVASYRESLLTLVAIAIVLIAVLIFSRVPPQRALWSLTTVCATVLFSAGLSALLQNGLSLFDIMALALVAGLGLDYALFYSLNDTTDENSATAQSVKICAISSLLVFSVLACSSIPVLHGIGLTVSIGVLCAYALARLGRYANAAS